jgi:hypothetical protein
MKTRTKLLLALASPLIAAALYAAVRFEPARKELCLYQGGKWDDATGDCVTRSCYQSNSCGYSLHPSHGCSRLKPGDAIAEVYFQLGQPSQIDGNFYRWIDGKPAGEPSILAVIDRGELVSLACPR